MEIGGHANKPPLFIFREIIEKINEHLSEGIQNFREAITVKEVALKLSINQNDLNNWFYGK